MRLLIVEDDPDQAFLVATALGDVGFTAHDHVATVADAERLLAANRYDLMVLDLGLPDADGLELLGRQHHRVPVLVVTGDPDAGRRVRALDLGADDMVVKPFDLMELGIRARRALKVRDGQAAVEMVTRTMADELTMMAEAAERQDASILEDFRMLLARRCAPLAARMERVGAAVQRLAEAVDLQELGDRLGQAAGCYQLGALTLDDAAVDAVLHDEPSARAACAVATAELLRQRLPLGASAASFADAGAQFARHVDRLAASMTAVCHCADLALSRTGDERTAALVALRGNEELDQYLVDAYLLECRLPEN